MCQAIKTTSKNYSNLVDELNNLENNLESRYYRTRQIENLEKTIRVTRKAIKTTSEDYSNLADWLNNLGNKLES